MHHDIGAGAVFQRALRAKARTFRQMNGIGEAAPQRSIRFLLGCETARAYKSIAIIRDALAKIDLMHHPVAVEGMKASQRLVNLIFRVAEIDAVDVAGYRALDHIELEGVHFLKERCPGAV